MSDAPSFPALVRSLLATTGNPVDEAMVSAIVAGADVFNAELLGALKDARAVMLEARPLVERLAMSQLLHRYDAAVRQASTAITRAESKP